MPIVVLGLSHRTAPAEVRNRHVFPPERVTEALAALRDYGAVREAAIVSTCNRLEIYADITDFEAGVGELKAFLTTYRNMRVDDFDKYLYTMLGAEAVDQLFRVASGIDSMLIGEAEIMAQVRQALRAATAAGTAGPHLNRLFRAALETGKRARTETPIGRDVVSFGAAAIELASRHFTLREVNCLVIGAGKMGATVARHLAVRGAVALSVANRTLSRGQRLADEIGATALDLGSLPQALESADLIVSATGSGSPMLTCELLRPALSRPRAGELLIIDLAVPRDVEQDVGFLPGVKLYELGHLREIIDSNLGGRRSAIPRVEAIIASQVSAYMRWYQSRAAVPLIATLRRKAEQIRSTEIEKLLTRLPELDERQRHLIVAASVSIINKLLHAPVTRIRESAGAASGSEPDYQALQRLFNLASLSDQLERELSVKIASPLKPPAG